LLQIQRRPGNQTIHDCDEGGRYSSFGHRVSTAAIREVLVFGVLVAYVKLGDLVTIGLCGRRLCAAGPLTFVLIWMDSLALAIYQVDLKCIIYLLYGYPCCRPQPAESL
jgi:hypothetical protein